MRRRILPVLLVAASLPAMAAEPAPSLEFKSSVLRLNSTVQAWSAGQPWEKALPSSRRALAAIIAPQQVITTAEMVADATNLEFESPDGTRFAQAKVLAVDYEANLALLGPATAAAGAKLFANTTPLDIAPPPSIGTILDIYQIEDNGTALRTSGTVQSIDVSSTFLPSHNFLTYMVKASMQSAASSYTVPVLAHGKLAGLLSSYNSKDQICEVCATAIIARFIKAASHHPYTGFPSLGVAVAFTEDPQLRQWLKLPDDQGGVYISAVRKGSAAQAAGIRKGDVLLAFDGYQIDRRGYFQHPQYGSLSWGHLARGEHAVGDVVTLALLRDGQPLEVQASLTREEEQARLVPNYTFEHAPNYLVKGGFIFQELTLPMLQAFGEDWNSRAPLNLLDIYQNPESYQDRAERVVVLSGVIPTPATVGYESLRNLVVRKVNGKDIRNVKGLIAAFHSQPGELQAIEFAEDNFTIYLDEACSAAVDKQLLQRGIPHLSRAE
ncbi:MAG: PDZ domain-containing protein [Verrucomicrobia bacterium]|nr:MAG: PDZ domain-containing protein [Verrucomicrobiota bacterium]